MSKVEGPRTLKGTQEGWVVRVVGLGTTQVGPWWGVEDGQTVRVVGGLKSLQMADGGFGPVTVRLSGSPGQRGPLGDSTKLFKKRDRSLPWSSSGPGVSVRTLWS